MPPLRETVVYNNGSYRQEIKWEEWAGSFDAKTVLENSGMNIGEVVEFHKFMAFAARQTDPNRHLFGVIRHIPHDRRKKVTGKTRLAWDYYEITEMLGDFLTDVTGERQRLPDDVTSPDHWKEQTFGIAAEQIDYKRGNALPGIIRYFGLDPRNRVWVFVEGKTETEFIKYWFGAYDITLPSSRIVLVNLASLSGLSSQTFIDQAIEARNQAAPLFVLVDEDGGRVQREADLQTWVEQGLIATFGTAPQTGDKAGVQPGGYIWKPCFEDHNFTFDEQVQAWRLMLETRYGPGSINEDGFSLAVEKARKAGYGSSIKAIEKTAKSEQRNLLLAGKPIFTKPEMGRALAELFHDADRPMGRILTMIYQIADLKTGVYSPADNRVRYTRG